MPKKENEEDVAPNKGIKKKSQQKGKSAPTKKQTRKRKKKAWGDRAYKPRAPRKVNTEGFTTENLLKLMRSAASPAKKAVILNSTKTKISFDDNVLYTPRKTRSTQLLSPSKVELSTPEKGPYTTQVTTPNGSKLLPSRIIECDDGACTLFVSENKVGNSELKIPAKANDWLLKFKGVPQASLDGVVDYKITKQTILATEKIIRKRKDNGKNARSKSQNDLMGISAYEALIQAGCEVEKDIGQWLDFLPHNFVGDVSRCVKNLGLGTRFANAAMELVNRAIRQLLCRKKNPFDAIYLSIEPTWVSGFEKIRLLKSLKVTIKDAPGLIAKHQASITFNTLTLVKVCETDVKPIKEFILKKFSGEPKATANDNAAQSAPEVLAPIPVKAAPAPAAPAAAPNEDDFIIHKPLNFAYKNKNALANPRPSSPYKEPHQESPANVSIKSILCRV